MGIRDDIRTHTDELVAIRRDLHMHPELGFEEFRTADIIETYLTDLGLDPERMAKTGVVATLTGTAPGAESGPTLMLRADIDALPIQELTDLPYKSQNDGRMHACGHDAHTAMLMIAAKILVARKNEISGRVKFLFQPNEEVAGAEIMIEAGCLENPSVDAAMGIHIWTPLPSGTIAATPGGVMATMVPFRIVITGKGGHTGYPELAVDPIIAAADLIQTAQRLQTRDISLLTPTALVFSKIESGSKNNIIPDQVVLEGTVRFLYEPAANQEPVERLEEIVASVCAVHKCTYEMSSSTQNTVVMNDPRMVQLVRDVAREIVDDEAKILDHRSMAGEDFAAYARRVPAVFAFVGTADPAKGSDLPHHSPRFAIDESTMPTGVELFVRTALRYFEESNNRARDGKEER